MKKPILYIDMDGVIANFQKEVVDRSCGDITNENFINCNPEIENRVDEICQLHPRIFRDLKPIENSIEIITPLFDYFDIYFLSTPMYDIPESYMDKRIWLETHFGNKAKKRLILTHRKDLCIGDILIDDRLVNGCKDFNGKFIHFGSKEFPNWEIVYQFLMARLIK